MVKDKKSAKVKKKKSSASLITSTAETTGDVASLRVELDFQRAATRQAIRAANEMHSEKIKYECQANDEVNSKNDLASDMTRQYKSMLAIMQTRIDKLEEKNRTLSSELERCTLKLASTHAGMEIMCKEKDDIIDEYKVKLASMEGFYERVIKENVDSMMEEIEMTSARWSTNVKNSIHIKNKSLLVDFGLDMRLFE